jgi:hypothetical protein
MSGRAAPIPIGPPRARASAGGGGAGRGGASDSLPAAPIIGSLPPPSQLSFEMPDLSLPPSTPEAFSLVRARERGGPHGGALLARLARAVTFSPSHANVGNNPHAVFSLVPRPSHHPPSALSLASRPQAEMTTAETTQRLVGVSSAPSRTWIENARRAGCVKNEGGRTD